MIALEGPCILGRWGLGGFSEARAYVLSTGLFDGDWYTRAYPEIAASGADPLRHYLLRGAAEGRKPQLLFEPAFYASRYISPKDSVHPLVHYVEQGQRDDAQPHPLFDPVWYRSAYLSDRSFIGHPLAHYTMVGRIIGNRPNRFFDPAYYRLNNPEVVETGIDELWHFYAFGEGEGRAPCANFDPFSVMPALAGKSRGAKDTIKQSPRCQSSPNHANRAPGQALPPDNGREVRKLEAQLGQLVECEACGWKWDLALFRTGNHERLSHLAQEVDASKPFIAIVSHGFGGGTHRYAVRLIERLSATVNVVLLTGSQNLLEARIFTGKCASERVVFGETDSSRLVNFLNRLKLTQIIINHFYRVPMLREIISCSDVHLEIILHDYSFLSPQPHLVNRAGVFVGEDLELQEKFLLEAASEVPTVSLRSWQREHRWLLEKATKIVAFSHDAKARFLRRYPNLEITVAPPEEELPYGTRLPWNGSQGVRKILVLGELAPHKGFETVCEVAKEARALNVPVHIVLIGSSANNAKLCASGVIVRGKYQDDELDSLIALERADIIWFPAQCPETYSFTLSAALRSGLRILVSDLGALPERIAGRPGCRALAWSATSAEWLEGLTGPFD